MIKTSSKRLEVWETVLNSTVCPNCIEELYIDEQTANKEFVITGNDVFHIECYFEFHNINTEHPEG